MTLAEVLALHPGADASVADLNAAVVTATAKRAELLVAAREASQVRTDELLTAENKEQQQADRNAAQAQLDADRIGALLPQMRSDLAAATGRETVAELRAMVPAIVDADTVLQNWWAKEWPKMLPIALAGVQAFNAANDAREDFLAKVQRAFHSADVRAAAPDGLGVNVPPKRNNPAMLFMFWSFK